MKPTRRFGFRRLFIGRAVSKPGSKSGPDQQYQTRQSPRNESDTQAGTKAAVVGDGANDLWRERVAEEMEAEETDGEGGGAYRRWNGVYNRSIDRTSIEVEEKLGRKERRDSPVIRTEEEQRREWKRTKHAPAAEQIQRAMIGSKPSLCDPSADGCAHDSVHDGTRAGDHTGVCNGEPDRAVQKIGHPTGNPSGSKAERRNPECGTEVSRIPEQLREHGTVGFGSNVVLRAANRLAAPQCITEGQNQPR